MAKVLILDQSKSIRNTLRERLEFEGIAAESAENEAAASVLCERIPFDLIISDHETRLPESDVPFIVLSSEATVDSAIKALRNGAQDYLTKPIKMKLLVSRVQAILKRIDAEAAPAEPAAAGITVDRERYAVLRDGHEVALPRKEFALLDLLYSSPGKLFSREEIYAKIWGTEVVVGDRTIDVHIRKLRQKIGDERIVTVKGVGYKFEP